MWNFSTLFDPDAGILGWSRHPREGGRSGTRLTPLPHAPRGNDATAFMHGGESESVLYERRTHFQLLMSRQYPKTGQNVEFLYTFGPAGVFRSVISSLFSTGEESDLCGFQAPIAATDDLPFFFRDLAKLVEQGVKLDVGRGDLALDPL